MPNNTKTYSEILKMIPMNRTNTFLPEKRNHELIRIPINKIDPRGMLGSQSKVNRYSLKETEAPPIIVDSSNKIIDGLHRWAAAIKRKDTHIWAYRPIARKVK